MSKNEFFSDYSHYYFSFKDRQLIFFETIKATESNYFSFTNLICNYKSNSQKEQDKKARLCVDILPVLQKLLFQCDNEKKSRDEF